jgi:hypothetical protein
MNWGSEALTKPATPTLTPRQERLLKVQRELWPSLSPRERQLYNCMITEWVRGDGATFDQLKSRIRHSALCNADHLPTPDLAPRDNARELALKVLELTGNPTIEQIKSAYKAAARKRHPDAGGSHAQMIELNRAYRLLTKESEKQWKI